MVSFCMVTMEERLSWVSRILRVLGGKMAANIQSDTSLWLHNKLGQWILQLFPIWMAISFHHTISVLKHSKLPHFNLANQDQIRYIWDTPPLTVVACLSNQTIIVCDPSLYFCPLSGTSNDSWTGGSIVSQLNPDILKKIRNCFQVGSHLEKKKFLDVLLTQLSI